MLLKKRIVDFIVNLKFVYKVLFVCIVIFSIYILKDNKKEESNSFELGKKMIFKVKSLQEEKHDIPSKSTGFIKANKSVSILPLVNGRILKIHVKNGDFVRKGTVLIELDKLDLLKALEASKTKERNEKMKYDSAVSLYNKNYISESKFNDINYLYQLSKEQKERAAISASYAYIKAPFDGYVSDIYQSVNDYTDGKPLLKILDMSSLFVTTDVNVNLLSKIKVGDECNVLVRDVKLDCSIHSLNKSLNQITKSSYVKAKITNNKKVNLFHGEVSDIYIYQKNVLVNKIDASWVSVNDDGILGVKIIDEKKSKFIPVEILDDNENYIFIKSIGNNKRIITSGHEFVNSNYTIDESNIVNY